MKSDRRHELAENVLAKKLNALLDAIAPYKNHIYWTIIGILAVICIGLVLSRITQSSREKAWAEYFAAFSAPGEDLDGLQTRLENLSKDYQSGEVSVRIRLSAAQLLLTEACEMFPKNRADAIPKLEKALTYFKEARDKSGSDNILREQALFGLGQTHESLAVFRMPSENQDDLDSAIKTYEQLIANYPEGIFAKTTKSRLATLQSPSFGRLVKFYETTPQEAPKDEKESDPFDPTLPTPEDSLKILDELTNTPSESEEESKPAETE